MSDLSTAYPQPEAPTVPTQPTNIIPWISPLVNTFFENNLTFFSRQKLSTGYPQTYPQVSKHLLSLKPAWLSLKLIYTFFKYSIDTQSKIRIIYIMKNEKRPTKKALVQMLLDKGVDQKIVQSLSRANIDTLQWVLKQMS
jgi:hypothetical protein